MSFEFYRESNFKETEIGKIPEHWEVVKLGKVVKEIKQGKQLSSKEDKMGKDLKPFLRTSNVLWNRISISNLSYMYFSNSEFEKWKLNKGDVLVCEGGEVGRTAVWEEQIPDCSYQNHLHRVRLNEDKVINYYFSYFMEYAILIRKLFVNDANKTTIPNLSSSRLKQISIALPPLHEQKAIAEVLQIIQDAKEKTEEVIRATKELKRSMMKHLFTYGPVPLNEVDNVKLKETEIGKIPEHWEVVKLGAILKNQPKHKDLNTHSEIAFIPMSLIPDNNVFIDKWLYKKPEEIRSGIQVFNEDLLLAKITPCFENGKEGIVRNLPQGFAYATTEVIPIRLSSRLYNVFLAYYLKMDSVRYSLAQKMEGSTGRKRLHKSHIENLLIPLPPLSEQKAIAEILQTIDEKIQREEAKKQAIENLFKSMLNELMSGRLRVRKKSGEE